MPAIDPSVLQCVFYVYPDKPSAEAGEQIGGSGFFVARELELYPIYQQLYAVTNRHCIKKSGSKVVLRLTKNDGGSDFLETNASDWIEHPDLCDIAVYAVELELHKYEYNYVSARQFFTTPSLIAQHSIGPGDDVFMVGRFIRQDGRQRNLPLVRFGNISRMVGEPITDEYGIKQDSFLVEMRSLSGFSGSPVFVYINPTLARPPHFITPSERSQKYSQVFHGPWLLGVDWCHVADYKPVKEPDGMGDYRIVTPQQFVEANSGMAGVIPAWRVQEILDLPELVMQRKPVAERLLAENKSRGIAVSDFSTEQNTQKTPEGTEIPIPDKEQFLNDLEKASRKKN